MASRVSQRVTVVALLIAACVALPAAAAWAHPLGNFTENRSDAIVVGADAIQIEHVLDLAEIPTLQARPAMDSNGDGTVSSSELAAFSVRTCATSADALTLSVEGKRLALVQGASSGRLILGQAGLYTLRLMCAFSAQVQASAADGLLTFGDQDRPGTVGWREVTVQSDGTTLARSSAPAVSPSKDLRAYPTDALSSPSDVSTATVTYRLGGAPLAQQGAAVDAVTAVLPGGIDTLTGWLSSAATGATGTFTFALAILVALCVGAAHAVAPGHGKTIMAFYLAGRAERSLRAATQVALTVTATHTVGVLVLGLLVGTFATITPANLYPWLTALSGVLVAGVGISLLRVSARARRLAGYHAPHGPGHGHEHPIGHGQPTGHGHPGHGHPGHEHPHQEGHHHAPAHPNATASGASPVAVLLADVDHDDEQHTHDSGHTHDPGPTRSQGRSVDGAGGRRSLLAIGIAGGLVPSPSALVVLLGTAAIGRAWFGVLLVLAFGAGMATTLASAGLLAHRAARGFGRLAGAGQRPWIVRTTAVLPLITASAVMIVGASLAVRGLVAV
jgi:nickel/cobalt transporter (NicO) family protein